jgi:hypothetical protein
MCIAADARHATNPEVERLELITPVLALRESGSFKKRENETPQATVDVEPDVMQGSKATQSGYVVLVAIREVDSGANDLDKIFSAITDINTLYTRPP